jgi:hypothetical protein
MTFSDDCPCGRSQDLTFAESNDKIVIDRKIFNQVFELMCSSVDELVIYRYRDCNTFLASLNTYLSSDSAEVIESFEVRKSFLLLNHYCDSIPKALDEVDNRLEEARLVLNSISIVNTSFRGRQ